MVFPSGFYLSEAYVRRGVRDRILCFSITECCSIPCEAWVTTNAHMGKKLIYLFIYLLVYLSNRRLQDVISKGL